MVGLLPIGATKRSCQSCSTPYSKSYIRNGSYCDELTLDSSGGLHESGYSNSQASYFDYASEL
jgi:hypothetical protein